VSIAYVEQLQAEEKFLPHATLRLPRCPKRQLGDTTNDFAPDFFLKSTEKNPGIFLWLQKSGKLLNTSSKKIYKTIFSDRIGIY
jgi:hypothetical protein